MLKTRLGSIGRTAFAALLLNAVQAPLARSDPVSCLFRFSVYVRELDPLLAEAKYSTTSLIALNDRYFPFVDCDPDAMTRIASRSRFFRRAPYSERQDEYLFIFSSDDVAVSFSYWPKKRAADSPGAGFLEK